MLERKFRLRHEKDIKALFAKGRSIRNSLCLLRFGRNRIEISRLTVIAGTKVSKDAVVRNRVKRQFREILRFFEPRITPGFDVAVVVNRGALGRSYQELKTSLEILLKQARILHD